MRLIDADAYKKYLDENWIVANYNAIDVQPTVDAVPVVRCKDCIYRFTSCPMIHWRQNGYIHFFTEDTDYCSKGRKYAN